MREAGTEPAKAARYCRLAAEQAKQRFAHHEAARLWEQAITCIDEADGGQARDRLEAMIGLVRTLPHTGQLARARLLRRDAVRSALPLNDPAQLARAISAFDLPRAMFFREYGEIDHELVDAVEQTLARLPPGDHPLRCRLLTTLALELAAADSERGYQASGQAMEMARRLGDPGTLTTAMVGRWEASYRHDGLAERRSLGADLLALPGTPVTVTAGAHVALMMANCGTADFGAADAHADEAARIAGRYHLPTITTPVSAYRAMRAALDGDPASSGELYRAAADQIDQSGLHGQGTALRMLSRAALLIMQDRAAELASRRDGHPATPAAVPELYALGLAASGHAGEARTVAAKQRPLVQDRLWLFLTGIRGLLAVAIDDRESARSAYRRLMPFADRPAGADSLLITLWPVAQILGDLAGYLGMPSSRTHYERALAIAERAHVAPWREAAARRLREVR